MDESYIDCLMFIVLYISSVRKVTYHTPLLLFGDILNLIKFILVVCFDEHPFRLHGDLTQCDHYVSNKPKAASTT